MTVFSVELHAAAPNEKVWLILDFYFRICIVELFETCRRFQKEEEKEKKRVDVRGPSRGQGEGQVINERYSTDSIDLKVGRI